MLTKVVGIRKCRAIPPPAKILFERFFNDEPWIDFLTKLDQDAEITDIANSTTELEPNAICTEVRPGVAIAVIPETTWPQADELRPRLNTKLA